MRDTSSGRRISPQNVWGKLAESARLFKIMQNQAKSIEHKTGCERAPRGGVENQPCFHLKLVMLGMSRANLARRGAARHCACSALANPCHLRSGIIRHLCSGLARHLHSGIVRYLHSGIIRRLHSGPPLTQWYSGPSRRHTTNARPPMLQQLIVLTCASSRNRAQEGVQSGGHRIGLHHQGFLPKSLSTHEALFFRRCRRGISKAHFRAFWRQALPGMPAMLGSR